MLLIAIDPGREKFGYAIFRGKRMEEKGILPISHFASQAKKWREADKVILGKGTGWNLLHRLLKEQGLEKKIILVEERGSTEEARKRFFREVRGKGVIWFIRKWLNLPDRPVDDISAQILGENFLKTVDSADVVL